MNEHEELITRFYTSFRDKNYRAMQECYHDEIIFSDPVFQNLQGKKAKAMWHMLTSAASDLKIIHSQVKSSGNHGSCHWEAWYPFSLTGRKVHNVIDATFEFRMEKYGGIRITLISGDGAEWRSACREFSWDGPLW
jgi:hypothetical protein